MSSDWEPEFLTREIIDAIHEEQINAFGGLSGIRDESALESAIAAAANVYHYGGADLYEIAAAYAFHLAQAQAYFDGNKRTGVQAALVFLEARGIDTEDLSAEETHAMMIKIASREANRNDLAAYLRFQLPGKEKTP